MILINAQSGRDEKLGIFARYVPLAMPVGIATLAAYMIEKGHKVTVWDDAIKKLTADDIREVVRDHEKPYVFGISCLTASITRGHFLSRQIKEIFPDSVVIFGGIHPTVLPDETLNAGYADFIIRKEGEVPLENLYRAIRNNESWEHISNLSYKKDGKAIHNPDMPGPDMNDLPQFPYHLFDAHRDKYDFGFVIGSRGCPYNCIFCSQRSITGRRFTYRTPEKVVADIELLVNKYGKQLITFSDDNMLTNKERVKAMCRLIQDKGLHKQAAFQCQVRGDAIDDEILKILKDTNFVTLDFGLETASERLMVVINKNETVAENTHALELSKKYGFKLSGTFILGLPTETGEERLMSYRMAKKYLDYVRFNNATPYPGTKLYEIAKNEGRLNIGEDWSNLNACGTLVEGPFGNKQLAYVPVGTTELELKTDILKYNLLFSVRWKVIRDLMNRKSGTAGWFKMAPGWYMRPGEWFHLLRLGIHVAQSWAGLLVFIILTAVQRLAHQAPKKDN